MKSTIVSMIIVLIVMVTVPLIFLGEGNLASRFGFSGFGSSGEAPRLPTNIKAAVTDKKIDVYTWVDKYGVTQFSNTPHPDGKVSVKIVLSPDATNIMDPVKVPEPVEEVASGPRVFSLKKNPYTPGGMKEVVDDTVDARKQMNQRTAEQDKMMQELFPQQFTSK